MPKLPTCLKSKQVFRCRYYGKPGTDSGGHCFFSCHCAAVFRALLHRRLSRVAHYNTHPTIHSLPSQVLNFARGATDADFYSTCFDRFNPTRCDLILLEFGINGGDVGELAAVAHHKTGAPMALVTLYSCQFARDGDADAIQRGPKYEDYRAAVRKHRLLDIHLESWTSARYGNPCEHEARHTLFKADSHHLSDTGHAELGELVGRRLAEAYPAFFHKHRHHERVGAHGDGDDDLFCASSGEMLGSPQHDLATTFESDGWVYDTDVPGRRDKACWLTTQPKATLSSMHEFAAFSRVEMFVQFSNKLQGVLHVGCDKGEIGSVNTTWSSPWTVIHRYKFHNNDTSFVCDGRLRIVASNVGSTADAPVETKVCGVVVKK